MRGMALLGLVGLGLVACGARPSLRNLQPGLTYDFSKPSRDPDPTRNPAEELVNPPRMPGGEHPTYSPPGQATAEETVLRWGAVLAGVLAGGRVPLLQLSMQLDCLLILEACGAGRERAAGRLDVDR
jgi:hypothetical protein